MPASGAYCSLEEQEDRTNVCSISGSHMSEIEAKNSKTRCECWIARIRYWNISSRSARYGEISADNYHISSIMTRKFSQFRELDDSQRYRNYLWNVRKELYIGLDEGSSSVASESSVQSRFAPRERVMK